MESLDIRLTRLEENVKTINAKIDDNHMLASAERENTQQTLTKIMTTLNEWTGIRKALAATATILVTIGGIVGFWVNYFWPRH